MRYAVFYVGSINTRMRDQAVGSNRKQNSCYCQDSSSLIA